MKLLMAISTAACVAAIIEASPAGAFSLTIDDPLLSLGGSGDSSSSGGVGVSIGGSGDSGSDASVDVELDADVDVDAGGDGGGDGGALLDLFGNNKLVDTGDGDNLVTVDTNNDADALVTLFGGSNGDDGTDVAVDLLGGGGGGVDINADLLDGGGTDSDVSIGLFGEGQSQGGAAVSTGGGGFDDGVIVSLFGTGGGGGADSGGAVSSGGALVDPAQSLFGPGGGDTDDIETGSMGGAPAPAAGAPPSGAPSSGADNGGTGGGGNAGFAAMPPQPRQVAPGTTARVATRTNAAASTEGRCFTPDEQQISYLLGRSSYDASVAGSWQQASQVSIVSINLCPEAQARLAAALKADPDIEFMRRAVAANTKLMAELDPSYGPQNVLAVDKAGENVTVYVY